MNVFIKERLFAFIPGKMTDRLLGPFFTVF